MVVATAVGLLTLVLQHRDRRRGRKIQNNVRFRQSKLRSRIHLRPCRRRTRHLAAHHTHSHSLMAPKGLGMASVAPEGRERRPSPAAGGEEEEVVAEVAR